MSNLITEHLDLWTNAVKPKKAAGRGRGKGSSSKRELYGLKKLRELILELAVRGQLVPQDSNDEPASVLLERIAAEKARLIKEERLKTTASENILPSDLYLEAPKEWAWCRLGNLAKFIDYRGKTPKKLEAGIRLITAKNVRFGYIDQQPEEFISEDEYMGWMTRGFPRVGDLLFTPEAPLGNVAIIDLQEKFALAQRAICFQLHEAGVAEFLKVLIMSQPFQEQLQINATGMTARGIKAARLKEIPILLPPKEEQHRIVAKVDELMQLCDQLEQTTETNLDAHQTLVENLLAALVKPSPQPLSRKAGEGLKDTASCSPSPVQRERGLGGEGNAWQRIATHFDTLFTTEHSIDQLKQTILQLAVMGKLVPQDPNDEPASVLLEKIAAEKAQLIAEKKIKKQKALPPIGEDEKPFALPKGWVWCYLNDLHALVTDGDHQAPPKATEGVPFLVIGNLNTGRVNFDNCKFVPEEYFSGLDWGRKPIQADLLYTVTGSYGIPVKITSDRAFCVQRHVAILKSSDSTPGEYLSHVLSAKLAFDYATSVATGIAQKTVPLSGLRKMPIALPPLAEQHRIVAKVDELIALCDQLKTRLNTAQQTQWQLADAVARVNTTP